MMMVGILVLFGFFITCAPVQPPLGDLEDVSVRQ